MKTPEFWTDLWSQSGPFDLIDSIAEAKELVEAIQKDATDDIWHLIRNWVNDSTQLESMAIRDAVLYALREENIAKIEALGRMDSAEARTRSLLRVELINEPWNEIPSTKISIRCDMKSLNMKPEAFCEVIAKELVEKIKSQANHF